MKTTLLIMAAGLGSRYGGSKQVDTFGPNGEILMDYAVYDAICAGFNNIVFVVSEKVIDTVRKYCGDKFEGKLGTDGEKVNIRYAIQNFDNLPAWYRLPAERTKPFGTLSAVLAAKDIIHEPFAVINADDYYGYDAIKVLHAALVNIPASKKALMVGYKLKNTVSKHGSVSRGICKVSEGFLKDITEMYKITVFPDGSIRDVNNDPSGIALNPDSPVSMNTWGFSPEIFAEMQDYFERFLKNLPENELKAECIIPGFVDEQIKERKLNVNVLDTDSVWFGVTYNEDRITVKTALSLLHANGTYPKKLW